MDSATTTETAPSKLKQAEVKGGISNYISEWSKITKDSNILDLVDGVEFEFSGLPSQFSSPRVFHFDNKLKQEMDKEISSFVDRGIIETCVHEPDEIISNIFPRKKKSGKIRIIGNFKEINQNIVYRKFKQTTVQDVLNNIRPGAYLCSIDLSDAYYSINVKRRHRKFLKFEWDQKLYQFCGLPQGIGCSPRIFTKLMRVPLSFLRKMGINVLAYLDDFIIIADSYESCLRDTQKCIAVLQNLGYIVNFEKSSLTPAQSIEHLGLVIDSVNMTVRITDTKCQNMISLCRQLRAKSHPTILEVAKVLGTMISYLPGLELGQMHYRQLEFCQKFALFRTRFDYSKTLQLTDAALKDILWWENNVSVQRTELIKSKPTVFIETDSSNLYWGAKLVGGSSTQGSWNQVEQLDHINILELTAAKLGIQALCYDLTNVHIRVRSDNSTCVSYINKKGGSKSLKLNAISVDLWHWCLDHNIMISAEHIPGKFNIQADFLSRNIDNSGEWGLSVDVFQKIIDHFNIVPSIDLFASRLNHKCLRYVSWLPDPGSICTDALMQFFEGEMFWAFPPFNLLSKFLQKVDLEKLEGIIIAPYWPAQSYYPQLIALLCDIPLFIRWTPSLLNHPSGKTHPLGKRLKLMACAITGNSYKRGVFRRELLNSPYGDGVGVLSNPIRLTLENGSIFANGTNVRKVTHV